MAWSWASLLSALNYRYESAHIDWISARDLAVDAQTEWLNSNYELALWHIICSVRSLENAYEHTLGYGTWGDYYYLTPEMFHRCDPTTPYELTWQAICEAWVKNDFEGMEWTIACIDRMRTLMWDKPFDIKWAAKPTKTKE